MNPIKKSIAEIRAQLDELEKQLDELEKQLDESTAAAPTPDLMSPEDYAKHADVSLSTVKRWIGQGLPSMRRGHIVRVKVRDADAWTPEEKIKQSAARAAHGGRS